MNNIEKKGKMWLVSYLCFPDFAVVKSNSWLEAPDSYQSPSAPWDQLLHSRAPSKHMGIFLSSDFPEWSVAGKTFPIASLPYATL